VENGKKVMTPMMIVMVAIGGTDIMFALDSIPAIFGLTQNVFIVFTATTFSLLGLRQLYFLLDGLLDRLVYLKYGLAAILGFIGVKLILHALHENNLPFINGGEHVDVVEVPTFLSLGIIVGVLVVTIVASLVSPAGKALTVLGNLKRHSHEYLNKDFTDDPVERAKLWPRSSPTRTGSSTSTASTSAPRATSGSSSSYSAGSGTSRPATDARPT
jgi:tellurite resistance protein TerC